MGIRSRIQFESSDVFGAKRDGRDSILPQRVLSQFTMLTPGLLYGILESNSSPENQQTSGLRNCGPSLSQLGANLPAELQEGGRHA